MKQLAILLIGLFAGQCMAQLPDQAQREKVLEGLKQSGYVRQEGNTFIFKVKSASDTPRMRLLYSNLFAGSNANIRFDVDSKYFSGQKQKGNPFAGATPISGGTGESVRTPASLGGSGNTGELVLTKDKWIKAFGDFFTGFRLYLDNYIPVDFKDTADNTYRYYSRNASRFHIGGWSSRDVVNFSILPFRMDPATVYTTGLETYTSTISTSGDEWMIEMTMIRNREGRDRAPLFANCIDNMVCGSNGKWWINCYSMKINVFLKPAVVTGRDGKRYLTYSTARVTTIGNKRSDGMNAVVTNWNNAVFMRKFSVKIQDLFNEQRFKDLFAQTMANKFFRTGVPFTGIAIQRDGSMKLTGLPPNVTLGGGGGFIEVKDPLVAADTTIRRVSFTPSPIRDLCPSDKRRGDNDFENHMVDVAVNMYLKHERGREKDSVLKLTIEISGEEMFEDAGQTRAYVQGKWEKEIYRAPAGYVIERLEGERSKYFEFDADPNRPGTLTRIGECKMSFFRLSDGTFGYRIEPGILENLIISTDAPGDDFTPGATACTGCGFRIKELKLKQVDLVLKRIR